MHAKRTLHLILHATLTCTPAARRDMIRGVQRDFGRLDILVNNVGIQHVAPVHEFPDDKCASLRF